MNFPGCLRVALLSSLVALVGACGDDDGSPVDGGAGLDAGSAEDASVEDAPSAEDAASAEDASMTEDGSVIEDASIDDASMADAGGEDAGRSDAGADAGASDAGTDAGPSDAGGACHDHVFGGRAVSIEMVTRLPMLRGGTVVDGTYDLTSIQSTGALRGMARGTWVVTGSRIERIDVFTTGSTLPEPNPRTETFTTEGTMLSRAGTCFSTETFRNQYEASADEIRIQQGAIMFTYGRRR